jgi:hypothetical protein
MKVSDTNPSILFRAPGITTRRQSTDRKQTVPLLSSSGHHYPSPNRAIRFRTPAGGVTARQQSTDRMQAGPSLLSSWASPLVARHQAGPFAFDPAGSPTDTRPIHSLSSHRGSPTNTGPAHRRRTPGVHRPTPGLPIAVEPPGFTDRRQAFPSPSTPVVSSPDTRPSFRFRARGFIARYQSVHSLSGSRGFTAYRPTIMPVHSPFKPPGTGLEPGISPSLFRPMFSNRYLEEIS